MSQPNQPKLWYAAIPGSDYWACGPYKTPEEAILALIKQERLQVGDWVAVGWLKPHRPKIPAYLLLHTMQRDEGVTDDSWLEDTTEEQEKMLATMVNAAVFEWLRLVDKLPAFGTIDGIQEYQIGIGGVEL